MNTEIIDILVDVSNVLEDYEDGVEEDFTEDNDRIIYVNDNMFEALRRLYKHKQKVDEILKEHYDSQS